MSFEKNYNLEEILAKVNGLLAPVEKQEMEKVVVFKDISERILCLPLYFDLSRKNKELIIKIIEREL
tara:strand:- start:10730 stop:10930 length:201 start_codon:yes stop_codon:yes gene_type:complete